MGIVGVNSKDAHLVKIHQTIASLSARRNVDDDHLSTAAFRFHIVIARFVLDLRLSLTLWARACQLPLF
jgi:hypothetical protein